MNGRRFPESKVIKAIEGSGGVITDIAITLDCARSTIYEYINEFPNIKAALEEEKETLGDLCESQAVKQISDGNTSMIQFFLKTRFGGRGYAEQKEKSTADEFKGAKPTFEGTFSDFVANTKYPIPHPQQLEMVDFFNRDGIKLLLGSRGYGKTDYVTILANAYNIATRPEYSSLLITKEASRDKDIVEATIQALRDNNVTIKSASKTRIGMPLQQGKESALYALSIGSSGYRGRHVTRIIMDDPITPDDLYSPASRQRVMTVYEEVTNLTNDIFIIGQPVHKLDLYSKLRGQVQTLEMPYGTIPELDVDLEARRLAGVGEASIKANYMLELSIDDTMPFCKIEMADTFPSDGSVAFIDPSFKGGDYTAISIASGYFDKIAIVGFAYKKAWNDCLDEIKALFMRYNVQKLAFECNSLGTEPIRVMHSMGIPAVDIISSGNKHARILSAAVHLKSLLLCKESNSDYIDQVKNYEYGVPHDDAPDSLASLLIWLGLIERK